MPHSLEIEILEILFQQDQESYFSWLRIDHINVTCFCLMEGDANPSMCNRYQTHLGRVHLKKSAENAII